MGRNFVFGYVLVFFFLFSMQNQVPQIFIGMGLVISHIKALSIVIQPKLKHFNILSVEKNWFEIFNFGLISS